MSVFTSTTTYDFIAGWRKLFRAVCACWKPGGAFCVAGSWLAVGRNCGPEKVNRAFFFGTAEQRAGHRAERSAQQLAGWLSTETVTLKTAVEGSSFCPAEQRAVHRAERTA
jgi:hypothetical protein